MKTTKIIQWTVFLLLVLLIGGGGLYLIWHLIGLVAYPITGVVALLTIMAYAAYAALVGYMMVIAWVWLAEHDWFL